MHAIRAARSVARHPAFWLPVLLALGVDGYYYGMHFGRLPIRSDGWGYYLQLPSIFIFGDPHLAFLNRPDLPLDIAQYRLADGHWQGLSDHGAGYLDKYALGPAVLQLPFFLFALVIGHFRYADVNGFETVFQVANALSGAFYFGLGTFLVFRACRLRYDAGSSALAITSAVLATNVLFYASCDGSYSHIYGYGILAGLVYLWVRGAESGEAPSLPQFLLFGFLIGLAVMVRPTNAVYALLFLDFARKTRTRSLIAGGAVAFFASAVAASPQIALWYVTTGHLIYYSYVGEGFRFTAPDMVNYLFSIRKGVFYWHPLYLLMIVALLGQISRRPFEGLVALSVALLGLYFGASWGDFGDSFGSRQSVELLPVLLIPFAGAVSRLKSSRWRWPAAAGVIALAALNVRLFDGYIDGTLPRDYATRISHWHFWAKVLDLPAAAVTAGTKLDLRSGGNGDAYLKGGWSTPETLGTWTEGARARLALYLTNWNGDMMLDVTGRPFLVPVRHPDLAIEVVVNGVSVTRWSYDVEHDNRPVTRTARIPAELFATSSKLRIEFRIDQPASPAETAFPDNDRRKLGLYVSTISFGP